MFNTIQTNKPERAEFEESDFDDAAQKHFCNMRLSCRELRCFGVHCYSHESDFCKESSTNIRVLWQRICDQGDVRWSLQVIFYLQRDSDVEMIRRYPQVRRLPKS